MLYPLQFQPVFMERVWGGRNLERFGLDVPEGVIGEAWMISDHPHGTTQVANGDYAGYTLQRLKEELGEQVFGTKGVRTANDRFPLLIKWLDSQEDLSVQVHPADGYARLPEGESGKTEMWYVLDARPGARIVFGLKEDVDRQMLEAAIRDNRLMDCLHEVTVRTGDCFYLPSGTVHALGAGIVAAEIQQNSDAVYRLYDYGRPGLDGKPRALHIEDSLNVIRFGDSGAARIDTGLNRDNEWLELVRSPYFVTEKGRVDQVWHLTTDPDSFSILIALEGQGSIRWNGGVVNVNAGDCYLLPAGLGDYSLGGTATLLRSRLP